jgi:hypothetical protein
MAFGYPNVSSSNVSNLYKFSVQSAGGGMLWNNLGFGLQSSTGLAIVPSGTGWEIEAVDQWGGTLGTYDFGSQRPEWLTGGATPVTSAQAVLLVSPLAASLSGDSFVVFGVAGAFQGSVTISIP